MTTKADSDTKVKRTPRKKVGAAHEESQMSRVVGPSAIRERVSYRPRPVVAQVNKQWFIGRLEEKEWSLRELARRMGLDVSSVSLMMDGKRKMTAHEAGQIAHHLGVAVQDVLANAGVDVRGAKSQSVALSGWVGPDGYVVLGAVQGPQTVSGPAEGSEELSALRIQGGTMDGWVLFWKRQAPGVRPEAVGKLCVVQEAAGSDGKACLRVGWVKQGYEPGMWSLHPLDPVWDRAVSPVRLESAVPVGWIRQ